MHAARLAEACVQLEVCEAGYLEMTPKNLNDEGVDLNVQYSKVVHDRIGTAMDIQVKSVRAGTSKIRNTPNGYNYDLETDTYNHLLNHDRGSPFALVVVVFPSDCNWLVEDDATVMLRCERYMPNLSDAAVSTNKSTTTIHLRKDYPFNSQTLTNLIESYGKVKNV